MEVWGSEWIELGNGRLTAQGRGGGGGGASLTSKVTMEADKKSSVSRLTFSKCFLAFHFNWEHYEMLIRGHSKMTSPKSELFRCPCPCPSPLSLIFQTLPPRSPQPKNDKAFPIIHTRKYVLGSISYVCYIIPHVQLPFSNS